MCAVGRNLLSLVIVVAEFRLPLFCQCFTHASLIPKFVSHTPSFDVSSYSVCILSAHSFSCILFFITLIHAKNDHTHDCNNQNHTRVHVTSSFFHSHGPRRPRTRPRSWMANSSRGSLFLLLPASVIAFEFALRPHTLNTLIQRKRNRANLRADSITNDETRIGGCGDLDDISHHFIVAHDIHVMRCIYNK